MCAGRENGKTGARVKRTAVNVGAPNPEGEQDRVRVQGFEVLGETMSLTAKQPLNLPFRQEWAPI